MEKTLAHYTVFEQIGAGGMGAVYRARDTRLGRDVALKLLPPEMFADERARARLLQEARLASALNHPHICTIYEVGEADGQTYIAMELVRGRPLSEQIPPEGLAAESVLRYGAQVADALAHAHDHGIVHRDLKGANVVITADGRAKVLDFGLAKRTVAESGDEPLGPQRTAPPPWPSSPEPQPTSPQPRPVFTGSPPNPTDSGLVVGTPQYWAPETLRGEGASERSDIWALGVLLHRMATGGMPFQGRTPYDLSAAILHEQLPALPARVPAGLRAVIQRCLEKEPAQRFQRASEVRATLEILQHDLRVPAQEVPSAGRPAAGRPVAEQPAADRRSRMRRGVPLFAAAVLLVVVATGAGWLVWRQSGRPRELKQRQLTTDSSDPSSLAFISPDGKYLAAVGHAGLSLRAIDSGESHPLTLPEGFSFSGLFPFASWFPDGSQLLVSGHMADETPCIWAIPVLGGRARKIRGDGSFATLSRDGSRIAYMRQGKNGAEIWCARVSGEDPRRVIASDSTGMIPACPVWSPSGQRLAYARAVTGPQGLEMQLESCDLEGHRRHIFSAPPGQRMHYFTVPAWLPDGRLVFGLSDPPPSQGDMNLWSMRVDPRSGAPSGKPRRVTQWLRLSLVCPTGFSADGKRLTVGIVAYQSDCYIGRIAGGDSLLQDIKRLTRSDRMDWQPAWTPDSKAILFASNRNGSSDIFRQALDASEAEPLVTGPGDQSWPCISPDGRWILYEDLGSASAGNPAPTARLMRLPVAGGPPEAVLDMQPTAGYCCAAHPAPGATRASLCVLSEMQGADMVFMAFDPLLGRGRELTRVRAEVGSPWDLSPDGAALAIVVQDSVAHIRVVSLRDGATHDVRPNPQFGIESLAWAADSGSWLATGMVGRAGAEEWRLVRVAPGGKATALVPPQFWMYSSAASPDGRRVAYTNNTGESSVWLLEDF